jgi:hypothetical protein
MMTAGETTMAAAVMTMAAGETTMAAAVLTTMAERLMTTVVRLLTTATRPMTAMRPTTAQPLMGRGLVMGRVPAPQMMGPPLETLLLPPLVTAVLFLRQTKLRPAKIHHFRE